MSKAVYIRETFWESVVSDLVTLAVISVLIMLSSYLDNVVWNSLSIFLLFVYMVSKISTNSKVVEFKTKAEAIEWAQSLPSD